MARIAQLEILSETQRVYFNRIVIVIYIQFCRVFVAQIGQLEILRKRNVFIIKEL